jgi:hypothetical protein
MCGQGADSSGTRHVRKYPRPPFPLKVEQFRSRQGHFGGFEEFISSDPEVCITPIHMYAADKDSQLSSVNALPFRGFVRRMW